MRDATVTRSPSVAAGDTPAALAPVWERVLIALFVLVLVVPGIALVAGVDGGNEAEENRTLAPAPVFALDAASLRAWPGAASRYFEDHFAFRSTLVRWQAAIRFFGLHSSPNAAVWPGRDGWLFYADDGAIEDYTRQSLLTDDELREWATALQATQDWLAARGIRYLFVLAPDKHEVYSEAVPPTIARLHAVSRTDQLTEYLRQHSTVNVLDLRPALREAKAGGRLYHRTDTHWNDLGAFVAYQQIIRAMQLPATGPPRAMQDFVVRTDLTPGWDLAGMLGLASMIPEERVQFRPRGPARSHTYWPMHPNAYHESPRIITQVDDPSLPRALVYRDSFGSALVPFLSEHFSRVVYLWEYDLDPKLVELEQPDIVVQEWVGRRLSTRSPFYPF